MNFFGCPPEEIEYSMPLEPMRLDVIGEQQAALKKLLSHLVETHPTKLTSEQKHKLRDSYRLILLNVIYNSIRRTYTGVARAKESFDEGAYWYKLGLSYRFTVAALNRLTNDGYVLQHKGFYNHVGGFGRLTRIYAVEKLSEEIDAPLIGQHIEFSEDKQLIELKGFPYDAEMLSAEHVDIHRLRVINEYLDPIKWPQKGPMRLIYTGNPIRGGRVYTRVQNLPRGLRAELKVSHLPSVELDYKANHLMMLLAMEGVPLPADPYVEISEKSGCTRENVKEFITKSLGAESEITAFNALKRSRFNSKLFNEIKGATLSVYPTLTKALFTGVGVNLQSLEGQIALDIMYAGALADIPVIPVHDSFITSADHEDWLREQMYVQWMKHVKEGVMTRIEKK